MIRLFIEAEEMDMNDEFAPEVTNQEFTSANTSINSSKL